ncbi:MAG: L-fucose:H+ symporter permease [Bacteroidales bacterium]|nr:L-fucose:H+ symporter permease [Bacteroidales bacterium]
MSKVVTKQFLVPFILITSCFALWGFANDITNPMVKAFSKIFRMSVTEGALVQLAFYGGYFAMAFPAAIFIRKYSYKAGVLVGLGLYAVGGLLFWPAKEIGIYAFFLISYFILTCGLSFLETSCNPYILAMGDEETSTRRLNFAQCFNPCGSILGMFVAMNFIQARLDPRGADERALLSDTDFEALKQSDLSILVTPYLLIAVVIIVIMLVILFAKMPKNGEDNHDIRFWSTIKRIFSIGYYTEGVVAQFFYVGAQIMCWTFIIQYGTPILQGQAPNGFEQWLLSILHYDTPAVLDERAAEVLSQGYNILAMAFFIVSRFFCTYLMKYLNPGLMLTIFGTIAMVLLCGVIFCTGRDGLYCLVGISGCMSLMFPTIYGIALKGLGDDAKFGAAGLIMAILGGSVLPPLQASIIDLDATNPSTSSITYTNLSFILPLVCFLVVAIYGLRMRKR